MDYYFPFSTFFRSYFLAQEAATRPSNSDLKSPSNILSDWARERNSRVPNWDRGKNPPGFFVTGFFVTGPFCTRILHFPAGFFVTKDSRSFSRNESRSYSRELSRGVLRCLGVVTLNGRQSHHLSHALGLSRFKSRKQTRKPRKGGQGDFFRSRFGS